MLVVHKYLEMHMYYLKFILHLRVTISLKHQPTISSRFQTMPSEFLHLTTTMIHKLHLVIVNKTLTKSTPHFNSSGLSPDVIEARC